MTQVPRYRPIAFINIIDIHCNGIPPFISDAAKLLTHWGRVTHICVSKLTIFSSDKWLVTWPAPSHYLNQCWNIVNWTLGNKLQWNLNRNLFIFIQENAFENVVWKMAAILSGPQCVKGDDIWCHAECGVDIVVCYSPEYPDNRRRGYPAGRVGQFILSCHPENSEATWLENWRIFNWTNRTSWDAILKWALVDVLYFNWLWVSSPHFPHEPDHGYITSLVLIFKYHRTASSALLVSKCRYILPKVSKM